MMLTIESSIWSAEVVDKIASTMTKENAIKMVVEFLPEPVADKFEKIFEFEIN